MTARAAISAARIRVCNRVAPFLCVPLTGHWYFTILRLVSEVARGYNYGYNFDIFHAIFLLISAKATVTRRGQDGRVPPANLAMPTPFVSGWA